MANLFDDIQLKGLTLKNRIIVSPMCQYQSEHDGDVAPWHRVHYGSLALGGAGLLMVEATAVESRGRISERDLGLYRDEHMPALKDMVDFAHSFGTAMGIQLGHAGRKADVSENIVAPSQIQFSDRYKVPQALTLAELDSVVEAFVQAAQRAVQVGFDTIELHGAHGYLLHQFLSPISNHRTDEYGGSVENRLRFPLRIAQAVRKVMPDGMPLLIRVSGTEFDDNGYSMEDMVYYCREFKCVGVDIIDVSGGGNVPVAPPSIYPGYQVPYADVIRHQADIPVIAVGLLDNVQLAQSVLQEGRADMVAIARGFLRNKHWALQAARELGLPVDAPKPYQRAW